MAPLVAFRCSFIMIIIVLFCMLRKINWWWWWCEVQVPKMHHSKNFMGPQPRPGEVTMPLRPCSRRGDGALPTAQLPLLRSWSFRPRTHQTQIVFDGAAYDYSYLLLMYLLMLARYSTCMFTIESHVISMSLLLLRFSTYRAATYGEQAKGELVILVFDCPSGPQ